MWQAPNNRAKSALARRKAGKNGTSIIVGGLKRLEGTVLLDGKPFAGARAVLDDLASDKGFGFFTDKQLPEGREIKVTFQDPEPQEFTCRVLSCQSTGGFKILSDRSFVFRAWVEIKSQGAAPEAPAAQESAPADAPAANAAPADAPAAPAAEAAAETPAAAAAAEPEKAAA